jgi:hypothetical protein
LRLLGAGGKEIRGTLAHFHAKKECQEIFTKIFAKIFYNLFAH